MYPVRCPVCRGERYVELLVRSGRSHWGLPSQTTPTVPVWAWPWLGQETGHSWGVFSKQIQLYVERLVCDQYGTVNTKGHS